MFMNLNFLTSKHLFFFTVYGNLLYQQCVWYYYLPNIYCCNYHSDKKFLYVWIGLSRKTKAFSIKEKGCQYSSQHKWNCETFQVCSFTFHTLSCRNFLMILYFVRMTLLLGPPGSGKTTLLKALAGGLGKDLRV